MNEVEFKGAWALQIMDSRGYPTLEVHVQDSNGKIFSASAPSGASTGAHEAAELRDGGTAWAGRGVSKAIANVNGPIDLLLSSQPWAGQRAIDEALCDLDGTENKSGLGANAIVAVSMAVARAFAGNSGRALHTWVAHTLGRAERLPVPHFNVLNGGQHAANPLAFQEFMIAPVGASTLPEAIEWGADVYHALGALLRRKGLSSGLGDEGGYAPEITLPEKALDLIIEAIQAAGHDTGPKGISIALDPAANYFYEQGQYTVAGRTYSPEQLIGYYEKLLDSYPIWSLEDPLAEEDVASWPELTATLGHRVQIVGDDLFVTSGARVKEGIAAAQANAVLIKPNQVGTVSETLDTLSIAADGGFTAMVSHRSGETNDSFVADLTVGSGCGQLKAGAPARGERVAKYNRLLAIANANPSLPYGLGTPVGGESTRG